eukprot:CAMPEP_0174372414 /NCGR_PEP_ID=MMETSP0811_2-20130205/103525_1 /TAXON_ID=73025 ORGANISM="Eutreptiella gymnastica-like, Strain CCMP1594" /NCGR_SAMPLE_ID=MMETSP0811_2 /ASSEMBLY_ACC=CAM_ASM_000667 /LENGTH=486 /DNA_ID=CAMNT_0015519821 /DNA_START=78 /DNA_END=1536 /DNA_ORIENTATION=+
MRHAQLARNLDNEAVGPRTHPNAMEVEVPEDYEEFKKTLLVCENCGRRFAADRLEVHQRSCKAKPKRRVSTLQTSQIPVSLNSSLNLSESTSNAMKAEPAHSSPSEKKKEGPPHGAPTGNPRRPSSSSQKRPVSTSPVPEAFVSQQPTAKKGGTDASLSVKTKPLKSSPGTPSPRKTPCSFARNNNRTTSEGNADRRTYEANRSTTEVSTAKADLNRSVVSEPNGSVKPFDASSADDKKRFDDTTPLYSSTPCGAREAFRGRDSPPWDLEESTRSVKTAISEAERRQNLSLSQFISIASQELDLLQQQNSRRSAQSKIARESRQTERGASLRTRSKGPESNFSTSVQMQMGEGGEQKVPQMGESGGKRRSRSAVATSASLSAPRTAGDAKTQKQPSSDGNEAPSSCHGTPPSRRGRAAESGPEPPASAGLQGQGGAVQGHASALSAATASSMCKSAFVLIAARKDCEQRRLRLRSACALPSWILWF